MTDTPPKNDGPGADASQPPPIRGLDEARVALETAGRKPRALPPVHLWNPPDCGAIDIRIRRDGVWEYLGSEIRRPALVRLFSTILRREPDGSYVLVTPVEKMTIQVEDAPFVAVGLQADGTGQGQVLTFRTNVGDVVRADGDHPIDVHIDPDTAEPSPYIHVRSALHALIARPVFYDLVELASEADVDGQVMFGVWSAGFFFPFAPSAEVHGG